MKYDELIIYLKKVAIKTPDGWDLKKEFIEKAENYVKFYLNKVSPSQIRNLFNAVDQKKTTEELIMLIPELKYAAGKKGTDQVLKKAIIDLYIPIIATVNDELKLNAFKNFNKAIFCFHKYHENTKSNNQHGTNYQNKNRRGNSSNHGSSYRGKQGSNRGRSTR